MNASNLAYAAAFDPPEPTPSVSSDAWLTLTTVVPSTGFPEEAVREVETHWADYAAQVNGALEAVARHPEVARDNEYMAHLFAMFLAAKHRDTRAHEALVTMAHFPEDLIEDVLGDIVTDGLGRCLASTCGGDESRIRAIIENEHIYTWSRLAGMSALMARVMEGDAERTATADYLIQLAQIEVEKRQRDATRDDVFLSSLAANLSDLALPHALPFLRTWYDQGLLDPMVVDLDWAEDRVNLTFEELKADARHDHYVHSACEEMQWWACFHPMPIPEHAPARLKIGRNEPCPCGSGKKFKKCCLENR